MKLNPENRKSERFHSKARITLEQCCIRYSYHGTMFNYSEGGMYLESNYAPRPDTKIRIRIEKLPFIYALHVCFAKVVWRKRVTENDSTYPYGIGLKYC